MLAGLTSAFGWAPWHLWPLAIAGHAVLALATLHTASPWQAAGRTGVFALALHATGHGWVIGTLDELTGLSAAAATAGSVAAGLYLCLFTMLPALAWHAALRRTAVAGPPLARGLALLAWAALMTLGESLRADASGGLSSLVLGYALIDTPWAAAAPWGGAHLVSLAGWSLAAGLGLWTAWGAALPPLLVAGLLAGAPLLSPLLDLRPDGPPWTFALVQTHVHQSGKFHPGTVDRQVAGLVTAITGQRADLILTPETALPMPLHAVPAPALAALQQHADRSGAHIVLGLTTASAAAQGRNSLVHVAPGQPSWRQLHKTRLMPFGETLPRGLGWLSDDLDIALHDLEPGPSRQEPLLLEKAGAALRAGALICQEELFADAARQWLARSSPAGVLLNPTNMAWFDGTPAMPQRLQVARMRALEAGRPVLRVANAGITAHIDAHGRIVDQLPPGTTAVLTGKVQPLRGLTPFAAWGMTPLWGACAVVAGAVGLTQHRQRRRGSVA